MNFTASIMSAGIALIGCAVTYGALRQKVNDVAERLTAQEHRLDRLSEAVGAVAALSAEVRSFAAEARSAQELVMSKLDGFDRLYTERLDNLKDRLERASRTRSPARTKTG
jgi:ABC-type transporter Mla subunit MlaD